MQKTTDATGDLSDKHYRIKIVQSVPYMASQTNEDSIEMPKGKYISLEQRQRIIKELRLI